MERHTIVVAVSNEPVRNALVLALQAAGHVVGLGMGQADFGLLEFPAEQALAKKLAASGVPFAVLAAHDDASLRQSAIQTGAQAYFVQPLDPSVLVPSIGAWVARAAELRELARERESWLQSLRSSRSISTAVGVLMERHRLSAAQAFDTLRRQARQERIQLAQLAGGIVTGAARLRPEPPAG
jgi:AmiR/NasT family two-component response regulator